MVDVQNEIVFVTRAQAAALLAISERSLDLMIAGGRLPVSRLGRKVLIRNADVRKLADAITADAKRTA